MKRRAKEELVGEAFRADAEALRELKQCAREFVSMVTAHPVSNLQRAALAYAAANRRLYRATRS